MKINYYEVVYNNNIVGTANSIEEAGIIGCELDCNNVFIREYNDKGNYILIRLEKM
jgi:hypothetical protein